MKTLNVFHIILVFIFISNAYSQNRQRYQTTSSTYVDDKMYSSDVNLYQLQQLINEKKQEYWDENFPQAQSYYYSERYVDCINLCFKIINKTEWTSSNIYFLIGDSYKNIRYYKSAKKYLKKAMKKGNYKAESQLEDLKRSYKNDKTQWINK